MAQEATEPLNRPKSLVYIGGLEHGKDQNVQKSS